MWPSPYLDAYGEEDIDLRRGKPLFLCQERYASLTAMVLVSVSFLVVSLLKPLCSRIVALFLKLSMGSQR
jgi:hypothetical protein